MLTSWQANIGVPTVAWGSKGIDGVVGPDERLISGYRGALGVVWKDELDAALF